MQATLLTPVGVGFPAGVLGHGLTRIGSRDA